MLDQETLKLTGLQMEYSFLCDQILKRHEMRQKMIQLTLTIAAAFLGVALTRNISSSVALVFPPIAALLEIEWYYLEKRQMQSLKYMRELEKKVPQLDLHWANARDLRIRSRFYIFALCGIFLFSQLMASFIGILRYDSKINNWEFNNSLTTPFVLLLFIDLFSMLVSMIIIWNLKIFTMHKIYN